MNIRDFRKKVIEFCIAQNKKCTERAKLVGEVEKEKIEVKLSDKAKNVKRVIDTGKFGCNTKAVTALMEIVLGETLPIEYQYESNDDDSDSKFENYDRKKKFAKYSIIECSDLNCYSNYGDKEFYIHLNGYIGDIPSEDYKWFEVATDEQTKKFINEIDTNMLKRIFAFLDLE